MSVTVPFVLLYVLQLSLGKAMAFAANSASAHCNLQFIKPLNSVQITLGTAGFANLDDQGCISLCFYRESDAFETFEEATCPCR